MKQFTGGLCAIPYTTTLIREEEADAAVPAVIRAVQQAQVADLIQRQPPVGGQLPPQRLFRKRVGDFLHTLFRCRFFYQAGDRLQILPAYGAVIEISHPPACGKRTVPVNAVLFGMVADAIP